MTKDSRRESNAWTAEDLIKSSVLRGYILAAQHMTMLDEVIANVPARTAALMRTPPPNTVWLPGITVEHVADAVLAVRGMPAVRECGRLSVEFGTGKIARPLIEGFLRLFGASPAALFLRYQTMSSSLCKHVEFTYRAEGSNQGSLEMWIPCRPVSDASFHATSGALLNVLELCSKKGDASQAERVTRPYGGAARYRIRWDE